MTAGEHALIMQGCVEGFQEVEPESTGVVRVEDELGVAWANSCLTRVDFRQSPWLRLCIATQTAFGSSRLKQVEVRSWRCGHSATPSLRGLVSQPKLQGLSRRILTCVASGCFLKLVTHSPHTVTQWPFLRPFSFPEETDANLLGLRGVPSLLT